MDEIRSESEKSKITDTKPERFLRNLQNYFTEYCENSSIHGVKYLGEQKRIIIEKLWWFIALTLALYYCIILIRATYSKWENSPVIVSFATTETPIWKTPFPAVTICPETKSVPKIFNYAEFLHKKQRGEVVPRDDELRLSYVSLLCSYRPGLNLSVNRFGDDDIFDTFQKVGPKFLEKISECAFMGIPHNCSELFTPIITDAGLCYSFNILHRNDILSDIVKHYNDFHSKSINASEWSLQYGYGKKSGKNTYPRRALYAGVSFSFDLKIETTSEDLDSECLKTLQGYKIQIHHPSMLPRVKQQHFRLPLNQVVLAAIMPTMITTSDDIKHYPSERRECLFPSERQLKYFKVYTQQNCQIECKTNFTLEMCGCVDFYMPRDHVTKICGAPMKPCMLKAEKMLLSQNIENQLRRNGGLPMSNDTLYKSSKNCNCMPDCTSISYVIETSQSNWDSALNQLDQIFSSQENFTTHMSQLQIFFKANQFITSERNELFGPTDFLANCGGLLGLFTGFSFLSLVEILYYCTLRLCCNIKLFGIKYWAGEGN